MNGGPLFVCPKADPVKVLGYLTVVAGCLRSTRGDAREHDLFGLPALTACRDVCATVIFNKKAKDIAGLENAMWQLLTAF
jgi:hypothetical protein